MNQVFAAQRENPAMRRWCFGLAVAVVCGSVGGGQQPKAPPAADKPRVYLGKVVRPAAPAGKAGGGGLTLVAEDGTVYPVLEDAGSAMLSADDRLRNRPVRLTAVQGAGAKALRVVLVQTVKDGQVFDVDYWCGVCQISLSYPGACVCCGDDTEFRERPAR
jgi:hypothetical protein